MIPFVLQSNFKRRMICPVLPPFHPPFCAIQAPPEMAFGGANGGTEGGYGRIGMKEDMAE